MFFLFVKKMTEREQNIREQMLWTRVNSEVEKYTFLLKFHSSCFSCAIRVLLSVCISASHIILHSCVMRFCFFFSFFLFALTHKFFYCESIAFCTFCFSTLVLSSDWRQNGAIHRTAILLDVSHGKWYKSIAEKKPAVWHLHFFGTKKFFNFIDDRLVARLTFFFTIGTPITCDLLQCHLNLEW